MKEFRLKLISLLVSVLFLVQNVQAKLDMKEKLEKLRKEMENDNYKAYIIPAEDEHQSEYVSPYDKRRAWISGFTGSSGTAVVTMDKAALWTDSRYFIAAEAQLDSTYWTLMRGGEAGVPSIDAWLAEQLAPGDAVGESAKFVSIEAWRSRERELNKSSVVFRNSPDNLIDRIWTDDRPPKPTSPLYVHDLKFAGLSWRQKIYLVKAKIREAGADYFVVTALDEVAWLFNLRGSDIPYNPMFFGYAIIDGNGDNNRLFIDTERMDERLKEYLKDGNGEVSLKEYSTIFNAVQQDANDNKKMWVSPLSSYAIYSAIPNKDNMVIKSSPIRSIKARKTATEITNIRACQIRDSAARIRHMHWLEEKMKNGEVVTEMTSADKLEEIQSQDPNFRSLSFNSISAAGANAAIVHYNTAEGDNSTLTKDKIYMLDAGAQYLDCTTDITRTHHFGQPSAKEIMAYTKVLQGSIDLAKVVFPIGVYGREIDVEARHPLWNVGLDYAHGTGHGIGYFLSVHESPASISHRSRSESDEPLDIGMVESDEPGYYEQGSFGMRLETDIEVVQADTAFNAKKFLKFDLLSLVPFEKNLIDVCQLTREQTNWLNMYNSLIREKVRPLLKGSELNYLDEKTEPFKYWNQYESCNKITAGSFKLSGHVLLVIFASLIVISFHF